MTIFIICTFFLINSFTVESTSCANRPTELLNAQLYCAEIPEVQGGIVDKFESKAKSFFNKAKQELGQQLGIQVDNAEEPKKCEYYKCIFQQLKMINQLKLPDLSLIQNWINANLDETSAKGLDGEVASCFRMLATSAINLQNDCETSSRLMMCLHSVDKCEIFQFP